ncbi:MAG: hypothetical protein IK065_02055, partial [Neisseriaceae bacterium]|nr:hypothetical protein [Neisseriaceae bacterium]
MCGDLNMSLRQDVVDIYTKSSVYYLRLQYLIICYLIVLAGAFFVLPIPRQIGIDGVARLLIGSLLYIAFAVLLVYAPELLYPLIGKALSPYKDAKEVQRKFNAQFNILSAKEKEEVEKAIEAEYGVAFKKNGVLVLTMNKMQRVATNVFFQCLLIELFCLAVLINQDHSLMISNPVTQNIADFLSQYTDSTPPKYNGAFFRIDGGLISGEDNVDDDIPFLEYAYMAESIFFMQAALISSCIVRFFSMFIFSRPILSREDVFPVVKNSTKSIKNMLFALIGTVICLTIFICGPWLVFGELGFSIASMNTKLYWIEYSIGWLTVFMLMSLFSWRFMEDWYKLIFRKF